MKKHVLWLTLILMAVFSSAAVSTKAQTSYGIRGNVPFDFIVGDKTLQAGKIVAGVPRPEAAPMTIRNIDNGQHALRIARSLRGADMSDPAKLVFRKYGNRYFLAEVWVPGLRVWEVIKSRSERALERETRLARNSKPELVIVAADTQ